MASPLSVVYSTHHKYNASVVFTDDIFNTTIKHAIAMNKNGQVVIYAANYSHLYLFKHTDMGEHTTSVYTDMEACRLKPSRVILVQPQWISHERVKVILLGLFLSPDVEAVIITDDKECAERIRYHMNQ